MASKVPNFGVWEGEENYTVNFENARKTKGNGKNLNPNGSVDSTKGSKANPSQNRARKQIKQTKVPNFGAWENGESVGYTACFENVRETKNSGPIKERPMNRDIASQARAQAQPQARRPETREARPKVPKFGDWESEEEGSYTAAFERLNKTDNPTSKGLRKVGPPPPPKGRAKVPTFGAWDGGEAVQYTPYFDNAKKSKNLRPGFKPIEPQLNRDVGPVVWPPQSRGPTSAVPSRGNQSHVTRTVPIRGNKAGSIPQFGGWNDDPSQAEGYTGAFSVAKEEGKTPLEKSNPPSYHQQIRHSKQQQPSCCSIL